MIGIMPWSSLPNATFEYIPSMLYNLSGPGSRIVTLSVTRPLFSLVYSKCKCGANQDVRQKPLEWKRPQGYHIGDQDKYFVTGDEAVSHRATDNAMIRIKPQVMGSTATSDR